MLLRKRMNRGCTVRGPATIYCQMAYDEDFWPAEIIYAKIVIYRFNYNAVTKRTFSRQHCGSFQRKTGFIGAKLIPVLMWDCETLEVTTLWLAENTYIPHYWYGCEKWKPQVQTYSWLFIQPKKLKRYRLRLVAGKIVILRLSEG